MEELVWVAVVGVVALIPPVRRRLPPVAKAVLSAGLSTAAAGLRGIEGILEAAIEGEGARAGEAATSKGPEMLSTRAASTTRRRPRTDTRAL